MHDELLYCMDYPHHLCFSLCYKNTTQKGLEDVNREAEKKCATWHNFFLLF